MSGAVRRSVVGVASELRRIKGGDTVFSAIQPTGVFHLGNYLGAVRSWVDIAERAPKEARIFYAVADLHALTVPKPADQLRKWREQAIASIVATGVDPERCVVYHQSSVPEHSELCWILSTITSMGYLNRMVQWKSKAQLAEESTLSGMTEGELGKLRLGLFSYPVLQAADILLHKAEFVPVGEDQSQHLELTRQVVTSFNSQFNKRVFGSPKTLLAPYRKIGSLRDPSKKMSKSDPDQNGCIYVTDEPDVIRRKVRRAVTDSVQGPITYDPENRPGVANMLLAVTGLLQKEDPAALLTDQFAHVKDHKTFKDAVSDVFVEQLRPVRDEYNKLISEPAYLDSISRSGTERARDSAITTINEVKDVVGL
ncbi:hypothetical protein TRICI_001919 [Trichomonascus ciferrii]|uniref:Tryptophan--tRNA ligase, mitochondrial n=1 Tax=Trichomonascus ciferrii TaxID=44093 RepID=A0A642VC50_9ASCO|nr:hypothetical protein TRICI_001919 [Trichomonascus ciferrii]